MPKQQAAINTRYKNISGVVQEKYVDGNKLERIEEPLNYDRSVTRILRKGKDRIKRMSKGIFP